MRNKVYWGLGVLLVLLVGAFVLVMVNQYAQIKQLEAEAKKAEAKANQMKDTPPVARDGFKMVPHGDHWHEVPIDAPDVWQGEPHEPKSQDPLPDMSKYKIDFPEDIPEDFPTEEELREMDLDLLIHLLELYTKESDKLKETDREAGIRLYNATYPVVRKIMGEKLEESKAKMDELMREHRKEFPVPRYIPATEDSSAVYIDVIPPEELSTEGGKQ